jgi:hypothetical protein
MAEKAWPPPQPPPLIIALAGRSGTCIEKGYFSTALFRNTYLDAIVSPESIAVLGKLDLFEPKGYPDMRSTHGTLRLGVTLMGIFSDASV